MFEEFYEMYEPEEQEVVALINRCIGADITTGQLLANDCCDAGHGVL